MNNMLESRWLFMFFRLTDFKAEHGHTNVPVENRRSKSLGFWVSRQRYLHTKGTLDPQREELLRILGFNFRLLSFHDWNKMFEKLTAFKKKFGHTRITESYEDRQLHDWLVYQRKLYWKGKLQYDKLNRLKELGVDMQNKTLNRWDNKFEGLVKFKKQYGHLYVCRYFTDDIQLINFVKVIRRSNRNNKISKERKSKLDELGFIWEPGMAVTRILTLKRAESVWETHYNELKAYKEKYGTCRVFAKSKEYPTLGGWVSVQRSRIKIMSQRKYILLKKIGFWEDNAYLLKVRPKDSQAFLKH